MISTTMFRRRSLFRLLGRSGLRLAVLGMAAAAGCGNYSNEDLEFMAAIPARDDLAIEVPRQSSLSLAGAAEGWMTTVKVTRDLNHVADAFLSLIDKIRSYSPTTRTPSERIWGPFPSAENPGWQGQFIMSKLDGPLPSFHYDLLMIPPPGTGLGPTSIINGRFDAEGGLRLGTGHLQVTLDDARTVGLLFPGLEKLRTMAIDYEVGSPLRHIGIDILNVPPSDPTKEAASATYVYERAANGDGAMTFSVLQDLFPASAAPEMLSVQSRWLGSGRGRADIAITGGDAPAVANSTECWQDSFESSYKLESWHPLDAAGDPSSCIGRL